MATTFVDYTGDGNATKSFSFPSIKEADIKVKVDDVLKSSGTHYNITSYTTTGGGNVVFTSGNIPASPADIHIYRDTDVDSAKATYTAGSSVKAGDLNNNHTQLLYALQEEQNQLIRVGKIKNDAINADKIADDVINSEHYAAGSIDHEHLANDIIDGDNIQDDVINSEHYAAGSIDTEHIADAQITTAKLADDSVNNSKLANNAITAGNIQNGVVGSVALATNAVTTDKITDSNVTTAKIADANITTAKIQDNAVTTAKIADSNVTSAKIANNSITSAKITDGAILNADVNASAAIAGTKISPDFGSQNIVTSGTGATGNLGVTGNITVSGTVDGRDVATDGSKLDGIESGATADQTAAEIRTLVESATDSNVFTDADHTKLNNLGSLNSLSDVNTSGVADGKILKYDASASEFIIADDGGSGSGGSSTFTGLSDTPANFGGAAGKAVKVNSGGSALEFAPADVVDDTTPQLGGNLDVQANEITTSTTNGNIKVTPNGTGLFEIKGNTNAGTLQLNCENNSHGVKIKSPAHSSAADYTLTLPPDDGLNHQLLKTDGNGVLTWTNIGADNLVTDAVTTTKIADDAVTIDKLADNSVGSAQIVNASIGTSDIALTAIDATLLSNNAVTTAKIADDAVTAAKLANLWEAKTADFNAASGAKYFVDTSGNTVTATLPTSAATGDEISFLDVAGTFDTNYLTIARNGHKIQRDASDMTVNLEAAGLTLVYYNSTHGWLLKDV